MLSSGSRNLLNRSSWTLESNDFEAEVMVTVVLGVVDTHAKSDPVFQKSRRGITTVMSVMKRRSHL